MGLVARKVPMPSAAPGERLLSVQRSCVFDPVPAPSSRFVFEDRLRKLLFFAWREGVAQTLRKVIAARMQLKAERSRSLVLAQGLDLVSGELLVALGSQPDARLPYMAFPQALCVQVSGAVDLSRVQAQLANWLAQEQLETWVRAYRTQSGLAVPAQLALHLGAFVRSGVEVDTSASGTDAPSGSASQSTPSHRLRLRSLPLPRRNRYQLFLVGAGAYPMVYTLPALPSAERQAVIELNPCLAAAAARRYRFNECATSLEAALPSLQEAPRPAVVIASYHDAHLRGAQTVLTARPDACVFIEKPPVVSRAQLAELETLVHSDHAISFGFNRRHAPMTARVTEYLARERGPITMVCTVKELLLPPSHWYFWPSQGTRIAGNLCHWLDLACHWIAAPVLRVHGLRRAEQAHEEVGITVEFDDGSLCHLLASDRGDGLRGVQERIELRRGGLTLLLDDYLELTVQATGLRKRHRARIRDKGHRRMYRHFEAQVRNLAPTGCDAAALLRSTDLYLRCIEELTAGPDSFGARALPSVSTAA